MATSALKIPIAISLLASNRSMPESEICWTVCLHCFFFFVRIVNTFSVDSMLMVQSPTGQVIGEQISVPMRDDHIDAEVRRAAWAHCGARTRVMCTE